MNFDAAFNILLKHEGGYINHALDPGKATNMGITEGPVMSIGLLISGMTDPGKVIVQVGAFADADKVREVRRKLEGAGLKTYTQTIEAKDGKRTTRVRVGPFDTRAEADKAAARIRKLDLPANVIAL